LTTQAGDPTHLLEASALGRTANKQAADAFAHILNQRERHAELHVECR
jgi:hypothetical protein